MTDQRHMVMRKTYIRPQISMAKNEALQPEGKVYYTYAEGVTYPSDAPS